MPNDNAPQNTKTPAFSLFVKQGEEPAGFGSIAVDSSGQPVSASQVASKIGDEAKASAAATMTMISDAAKHGAIIVHEAAMRDVANMMKAGWRRAYEMVAPSGEHGHVPADSVAQAKAEGFKHADEVKK